jgi:hypothetical protein
MTLRDALTMVIPAAAALLGAGLGAWQTNRHAESRWTVERRFEAYREILTAFYDLRRDCQVYARAEKAPQAPPDLYVKMRSSADRWNVARTAVELIGKSPVVVAALEVEDKLDILFRCATERQLSDGECRSLVDVAVAAKDDLVDKIRGEAGLGPLPRAGVGQR